MLKYLETYCDINELEPVAGYLRIGKLIEAKTYPKVLTYNVHGYVFYYFDLFIKEETSLEDFMQLGDIHSAINVYDYQSQHPASLDSVFTILESLKDWKIHNSLIIVDAISLSYFKETGDHTSLQSLLTKNNSELVSL